MSRIPSDEIVEHLADGTTRISDAYGVRISRPHARTHYTPRDGRLSCDHLSPEVDAEVAEMARRARERVHGVTLIVDGQPLGIGARRTPSRDQAALWVRDSLPDTYWVLVAGEYRAFRRCATDRWAWASWDATGDRRELMAHAARCRTNGKTVTFTRL